MTSSTDLLDGLPRTLFTPHSELDQFVEAFELALERGDCAQPAAFLPEPGHPLYRDVLRELIRVDLEFSWQHGRKKLLEEYTASCPQAFSDPSVLHEIAFEEYRLRRLAGEEPDPREYERRLGIKLSERLTPTRKGPESGGRQGGQAGPQPAEPLLLGPGNWPEVGTRFLGFGLLGELGRGAFARVYLAEQGDLANRPVALKVATDIFGESQTLAQLQHTNIVPIYSMHRADRFQAVCMPYLGSTTLADILARVNNEVTLPESGKVLVSTLNDRKASTFRSTSPATGAASSSAGSPPSQEAERSNCDEARPHSTPALQALEGMSYIDAVLWVGARLADGLAHAHERGVLHRDLKPANVLLTEDGQPMLLDFNLSASADAAVAGASIGGTLPYMAPEHLEAFAGEKRSVDARSDLYSLGVILYEMLTGKYPFRPVPRLSHSVLVEMIEERRQPPPGMRWWNPALSPAVESIVRHCLEPDPKERYQNARELHEDLERQLQHLPLRFAPEPSFKERIWKFARRHPRLTSASTMAGIAAVVIAVLATGLVVRGQQVARRDARDAFVTFEDRVRQAQVLLCARNPEREELAQGTELCQSALEQYRVVEDADWRKAPAVVRLAEDHRDRLRDEVGELLLLLADGTSRQALYQADGERRREQIQLAMRWNSLAEARAFGEEGSPALWRQRADLARLLGEDTEVQRASVRARETPVRTIRDLYLTAHEYFREGNPRAAIPLLQEATRRDPQNFPAWAVLANCHNELAQDEHALACYSACIALRPGFYPSWLDRGLIYLRQRFYELARADFDQVIALHPELADAYINRALAREGQADYGGAVADLDEVLRRGTPRTRVYFMRAIAREQLGDKEGASRDRERGLRERPLDEKSWIARGLARAASDPQGALADFEEALVWNPRSVDALQNKASLLAESGKTKEAIQALDEALTLSPDFVPARAGRGVLLARLGQRALAEKDARQALELDSKPSNLYQVAGIFALNSRHVPADRFRALDLLSAALRSGFGLDLVDQDRDLDPIRSYQEFQNIVEAAARALHEKGSN
jgi:serine/threonine protein kinase/Tfp pilus assembly protein PilF